MKKLITSILILSAVVTSFYGCRKNDNPKLPDGIETGVYPLLTQDTTGDFLIQEMDKFKTAFDLSLYFPNSVKPQKMDVKVIMNGKYGDVRTLQADVTSFPTKINVTGPQLAQLFGKTIAQIQSGDNFTISPDITLPNGKVLTAFSRGISGADTINLAPYGSDALNLPGANPSITYSKVCPLFIDSLANILPVGSSQGALIVDDPDFWEDKYPVTSTLEGANVIKLTGWIGLPNAVIRITVDPKTQKVTVPKQVYAPTLPTTPYHNPAVVGTGTINACNNTISLKLENSVDEGGFGAANVTISHP